MKIMVSREVRIVDAFKVFPDTIAIYQNAVSFLIDVVNEHYVNVCGLHTMLMSVVFPPRRL